MLYYLALGISSFIGFLLLKWRRKQFYSLAENSVALLNTLISNEGDEEKLEQMQKQTSRLVFSLLAFIALLLLVLIILVAPAAGNAWQQEGDWTAFSLSSWQEILSISLGASLVFIPLPPKEASSYSELSQLLHRMALNNYHLGLKLFKREAKQKLKKGISPKKDFIIISGLARSGTTSLMNHLLSVQGFASLSYANMPFLMSPNTWRKIYNPKDTSTKERSHKDGINIGLLSHEALEEYFFKALAQDAYLRQDRLIEYTLKGDDYQNYLSYQSLVRGSEKDIYLAKNNNFLLRYKSMREHNSQFLLVVLFRHPLLQASSLLEKHQSYSSIQRKDPFVGEYMDWLGHHEFGLNQKAFQFAGQEIPSGDKNSLDYWLKIWLNYYRYALSIEDAKTVFIQYESFCAHPQENIAAILAQAGLGEPVPSIKSFSNPRQKSVNFLYDEMLMQEALAVWQGLEKKAIL